MAVERRCGNRAACCAIPPRPEGRGFPRMLIKNLVRTGLMVSLWSASVAGLPFFAVPVMAQAMSVQEVAERLKAVPVFILVDSVGKRGLTLTIKEGGKEKELGFFFFSPQDAQSALQRVQAENPAIAKDVQIRAIGLDQAYQLAKTVQQKQEQNLDFSFQPDKTQVDAALKILEANGQKLSKFPGIPLFFITVGGQQNQLTVQIGDAKTGKTESVVPMFFNLQDADALLAQVKKQDAKLAESAQIQVANLDQLVAMMEQRNDPSLRQLYFIPSSSALRFIQEQQRSVGQPPRP
jgi:hypothetical protein